MSEVRFDPNAVERFQCISRGKLRQAIAEADYDALLALHRSRDGMEETLREVLKTVESDDAPWWLDEPGRGGFDADKIRAALELAAPPIAAEGESR